MATLVASSPDIDSPGVRRLPRYSRTVERADAARLLNLSPPEGVTEASQIFSGRSAYARGVKVEFECVICGTSATATVAEEAAESADGPLETLRECPDCNVETIWVEA